MQLLSDDLRLYVFAKGNNARPPHPLFSIMSINIALLTSLRVFGELAKLVEDIQYKYGAEVPAANWTDERGRLRIWAANVGAHQTGQSSLDFRLRDASHIRQEIVDLLTDLHRLLENIKDYLNEGPPEDESWSEDGLDDDPTTELQAYFRRVNTTIKCLYKMAMLIRNPTQHDLLVHSRSEVTAAFEPYDQQHVRNKFPQANEQLVLCLGRLITRRRRYLKYRKRHNVKLGKGLEGLEDGGDTRAESISETMASNFQAPESGFGDAISTSHRSTTSYASSLCQGGSLTIPAPPAESLEGKPFVCPYCFYIIETKSTKSWHRHIFTDLRPYSCVFEGCRWLDQLYSSRREWFTHVQGTHDLAEPVCPLCKDSPGGPKHFERHVARHLEELALFAMPREETEDEEHDQTSTPDIENDHHATESDVSKQDALPSETALAKNPSGRSDSAHSPIIVHENEAVAHGNDIPDGSRGPIRAIPDFERGEGPSCLEQGTEATTMNTDLEKQRIWVQEQRERLKKEMEEREPSRSIMEDGPIHFKDPIGRRFKFPFHNCRTWDDMKSFLKYIFRKVEIYEEEIEKDHYTLFISGSVVTSKQEWETTLKPGCEVTMLWKTGHPTLTGGSLPYSSYRQY
ncbi:MAG: hypothetical protein Q9218_007196 [Villophora microphyllina]